MLIAGKEIKDYIIYTKLKRSIESCENEKHLSMCWQLVYGILGARNIRFKDERRFGTVYYNDLANLWYAKKREIRNKEEEK